MSGMKSIRRPLLCYAPRHLKVVSPSLKNFSTKCNFRKMNRAKIFYPDVDVNSLGLGVVVQLCSAQCKAGIEKPNPSTGISVKI